MERKEQWKDMVKETAKKYERADNLSKMRSHEKRNQLLFFLITLLQNKIFTFTNGGRTGHIVPTDYSYHLSTIHT